MWMVVDGWLDGYVDGCGWLVDGFFDGCGWLLDGFLDGCGWLLDGCWMVFCMVVDG